MRLDVCPPPHLMRGQDWGGGWEGHRGLRGHGPALVGLEGPRWSWCP